MRTCRVPVLAVGSVAAAVAAVVAGAGTAAADTGSAGAWTSTEVGPATAGSDRSWTVTEVADRSASAGGGTGRDVSSRPVAPVTSGQRPRSVSRARRPWRPAVVCRVGHDGGVWTVHRGDTLSLVSRCTGVSQSRLTEAGDITDPDMLRIGQRIKIPTAPQAAPTTRTAPQAATATPSAASAASVVASSRSTAPVATQAAPVVAVVTVTVTVAPAGVRR